MTPENKNLNKKCKHEYGWLAIKNLVFFIFENGKIAFNFQSKNCRFYKIKIRCNNTECKAVRNVYVIGKIAKWGRINYDK
ncbi:MAG: hypothetical protein AABY22_21050 [Nanoarchaeota archaeon]